MTVIVAWRCRGAKPMEDNERQMAVSAIGNYLTTTMTANSVLLTGVGILSGLAVIDGRVASPDLLTQLILVVFGSSFH